AGGPGVAADRLSGWVVGAARQYAGGRPRRLCRGGRRGRLPHLAAAQGNCALDPARGRHRAQPRQRRERPRAGGSGIDAAECRPCRRPDHHAKPRHPADLDGQAGLAASRRDPQGSPATALEGVMADLRLKKLPDRTPVRITINLSPELNQALAEYADLYREAYGQQEPVQELIPAMLASFLEGD